MTAQEIRDHAAKQLGDFKQKILGERKEDVMLLVHAMGSSNVVFLLAEVAAQLAEMNERQAANQEGSFNHMQHVMVHQP